MTDRRYRVDDIVSIETTVEGLEPVDGNPGYRLRAGAGTYSTFWMTQTDMDRYAEPIFVAEDEPQPGDSVRRRWEAEEADASIGRVIAVDEDLAWVRFGGFSAVYPFCDLEIVGGQT